MTIQMPEEQSSVKSKASLKPAKRGEILAWASYDIANSTYGTVVATAVYNAYFVHVIADKVGDARHSSGTLLLSTIIFISSMAIVFSAPVIGTIADATGWKKKLLAVSTWCCIIATASLAFVGPGQVLAAMIILTIANIAFGTGEDLIAAFLPELAHKDDMGRISSLGWAAGYVGGLFSLGSCLAYTSWAQHQGQVATQYVPMTMVLAAVAFLIASTPTFLFLKERAEPDPEARTKNYFKVGFKRLKQTFTHARHYQDLFTFLIALFLYSCGTTTIIHMASVYAQEVVHFTASDSIIMILVVNLTAAVGASIFGYVQDRIGSVKTLLVTLSMWMVAIVIASLAQSKMQLWGAANLIGLAMGASGSVGRALVGQFSPHGRSGEFLGLWGLAVKLATAVGAVSFGTITYLTHSNYRAALITTDLFFFAGMMLLLRVNERRGRSAAQAEISS